MTSIGSVAAAAGTATDSKIADEKAKMVKTAQQFEAIFLRQMMGAMRSAKLSDDDVFGSSATDQFREMGDARTAENLSQTGGFGIAQLLLKQLEKMVPSASTSAAGAAATAAVATTGDVSAAASIEVKA